MERNNNKVQPQNGGKVTKFELNRLRNQLKNTTKFYVVELSEKTGFHKNTIHNVFNNKIGVSSSTRLTILSAAIILLEEYKKNMTAIKTKINK